MDLIRRPLTLLLVLSIMGVAACGNNRSSTASDDIGGRSIEDGGDNISSDRDTIWDIFDSSDSDVTVRVNKYLWAASLEVLDFLPVQSVDPFSGVISTGYGTPPGGSRAYRATVYIRDPALEARSLNVAMQTRSGGAVAAGTVQAVEDAIMTRARQLRIADNKF